MISICEGTDQHRTRRTTSMSSKKLRSSVAVINSTQSSLLLTSHPNGFGQTDTSLARSKRMPANHSKTLIEFFPETLWRKLLVTTEHSRPNIATYKLKRYVLTLFDLIPVHRLNCAYRTPCSHQRTLLWRACILYLQNGCHEPKVETQLLAKTDWVYSLKKCSPKGASHILRNKKPCRHFQYSFQAAYKCSLPKQWSVSDHGLQT